MYPFKVQTLIRLSHYTNTVVICFWFSFFDSLPPVSPSLLRTNYICIKYSKANNKCNSLFFMGIAPKLDFRALKKDTNVLCIFIIFFTLFNIIFPFPYCIWCFSYVYFCFFFMGAIPWREQAKK